MNYHRWFYLQTVCNNYVRTVCDKYNIDEGTICDET